MVLDSLTRRIRRSGPNPTKEGGPLTSAWDWTRLDSNTRAVDDESALSLTAFFRGMMIISRTIASFPIHIFEEEIDAQGREGDTHKIKTKKTAYLWRRPNSELTRQEFWELIVGDLVRGNAFIWVEKNDIGGVVALWYISRRRMRVGRTQSGLKVYEMDNELPMIDYKMGGEIIHMKNWGGSLVGYDPVTIGRAALAQGLSAREYATSFFDSDATPPGILSSPGVIPREEAEYIRDNWSKTGSGPKNQRKIRVLSNGATYQPIQTDPEKAQMVEVQKFSVSDVARLLGLPPFLLGDMDHASQGGGLGLEEQNRNLMTFTFAGYIQVIEQATSDDLLVRELTNQYMRMNLDALLRGTTLQRYQALKLADFMTPDEKRAKEELPPIPGGDVLQAPSTMMPAEMLGKNFEEEEEDAIQVPAQTAPTPSRNGRAHNIQI